MNKFDLLLSICLFCGLCLQSISANARYEVIGNKLMCSVNKEYFLNSSCSLKKINATTEFWTFEFVTKPGLSFPEAFVKFSLLHLSNHDFKYKPFIGLSNITMQLCDILDLKPNTIKAFREFFGRTLKDKSNARCPFKDLVYGRDLIVDESEFPSILPAGDYITSIIIYTHHLTEDKWLVTLNFFVMVRPKGTSKLITH